KSLIMSAAKVDIDTVADAISPSKNVEAVKESTPTKRKAEEVVEEVETKKARVNEPADTTEESKPEAPADEKKSEEEAEKEAEETVEVEKPDSQAEEAKTEEVSTAPSDEDREQARKVISAAFAKKEVENAEDKTKSVEEKIFTAKGANKTEFLHFAYSVAFNIATVEEFAYSLEDADKEISVEGITEETKAKITDKVEGFVKNAEADFDFDALTVSSQ
ncbi:hypothetical protein PFISCL1PPCAC_11545, partial [Pristionchus fissidentatus]